MRGLKSGREWVRGDTQMEISATSHAERTLMRLSRIENHFQLDGIEVDQNAPAIAAKKNTYSTYRKTKIRQTVIDHFRFAKMAQ